MATRSTGDPTAAQSFDRCGFEYVLARRAGHGWGAKVAAAARFVKEELDKASMPAAGVRLEPINSRRLQYKFARTISALPYPLKMVVKTLEEHMYARCGAGVTFSLQDCCEQVEPNTARWHAKSHNARCCLNS